MITKKDLLFLAILLANQDGLHANEFERYGLWRWFDAGPFWRLTKLVDFGLVRDIPMNTGGTVFVITPAGALAHFNAMR